MLLRFEVMGKGNATEPTLSRRTTLRSAAAVGLGSAGLAGCANVRDPSVDGADPEPDEEGTAEGPLELIHWWTAGGEAEALRALLEGFIEATEYEESAISENPAPGGAGSALNAAVQSRLVDDDPPSTFQLWPGESLRPFLDSDVLADISDIWADDLEESYIDSVRELARDGDAYVAVPINIHRLNNLFYNVDVVEDSGVDPETLDDPEALLEAFEAVDEAGYTPLAHQTQEAWPTLQLWETVFIGHAGADAFRTLLDRGVSSLETEVAESLRLVERYGDYASSDASSIAWDEANGQVIDGDAAFTHQGDWAAGHYGAVGLEYGEQWDYTAFPGTEDAYTMVLDAFVMPEPNPTPELTAAFLEYCGTADAQERFNPPKGSIPPRTDVSTEAFPPFLQDQMRDFDASSAQLPTLTHGSGIDPSTKNELEEIFTEFLDSWNVDEATDRILETLEDG